MKYIIKKLLREGLKKYDWKPIEIKVANIAKSKGLKLIKTWGNSSNETSYSLYNKPNLEGAWTINNELVWSHEISDITNYLNNYN